VKNTTIKQSITRTNNKQSRFDQLLYVVMQLIFRYYTSTQLSSNQVIRRREGISYCHQSVLESFTEITVTRNGTFWRPFRFPAGTHAVTRIFAQILVSFGFTPYTSPLASGLITSHQVAHKSPCRV